MEYTSLLLFLSFLWICFAVTTHTKRSRLPPGPFPLPIVGNLLKLDANLHKSLAELAKIHGPLMTLQLGNITNMVVSSSKMAKEILQKNDQAFANRTVPDSVKIIDHHKYSLVWIPYSSQWRDLRKLFNTGFYLSQSLEAKQELRHKKVEELVAFVEEKCKNKCAVEIGQVAFSTVLNFISNTVFSVDLTHLDSSYAQDFKAAVWGILEEAAKPNLSDFFPILRYIDPQGIRSRLEGHAKKLDKILGELINQRLESKELGVSETSCDFLDIILEFTHENGSKLCDAAVKALLKDIFVAGTDTSSSTVEWTMTELLKNPDIMVKAQSELRETITENKPIEESDIDNLHYLQAIIKETFRLHPPVPFLIPHRAVTDVEMCGFIVPKNTQVLINVWTMGRDPETWEDPITFRPERFLNSSMDFKGRDFELIPFGAGRRICPGLPLAHRMVTLMLASLLHVFDWKLEGGMKPEDIDMEGKFGITLQKAIPLKAVPCKIRSY
ncbi:unspecific monooxygenase [Ranunculus cassubicifolius]